MTSSQYLAVLLIYTFVGLPVLLFLIFKNKNDIMQAVYGLGAAAFFVFLFFGMMTAEGW